MTGRPILCVEDEERARAILARHLTRLGYRVRTAIDGGDALRAIGEEMPEGVITDLQMPVVDGIELCRRLRGAPATAHLPLLVVSGHPRIAELAAEAGADGWLAKPVTRAGLATCLSRLLAGGPAAAGR
ncbi:MAG: response regulator [Candidatus Dormibacteraceae bacterium]